MENKLPKLYLVFMLIALFSVMLFFLLSAQPVAADDNTAQYISNWELAENGSASVPVKLPVYLHSKAAELTATLPASAATDNYIFLYAKKQTILLEVGRQVLVEYATREQAYPAAAYGQWLFISVPSVLSGEEIKLTTENIYHRLPNTVEQIYFGQWDDCLASLINDNKVGLLLPGMVFLVGLITIILSYYYHRSAQEVFALRFMGWFLLLVALWGLGQAKLLPLIIANKQILLFLDFIPPMIAPIPIVMAFRSLTLPNGFQREYDNFVILFGGFFLISLILHFAGIIYLADTSLWSMLFLAVFFVYVIVFAFVEIRSTAGFPEYRLRLYSTLLFNIVCVVLLSVCVFLYFCSQISTRIILPAALLLCAITMLLVFQEMRTLRNIQTELEQSQIQLMLSQITPHFLFNTLNSIRTLVRVEPEKADSLLYNFSHFLRHNIEAIGSNKPIPFSEELAHITAYTSIEQACFPKLKVSYDIGIKNFLVPPLSIQPLVENSIKHGVLQRIEGGEVLIRTYETPNYYCVEIADDGVGFVPEIMLNKPGSYGLRNVRMRLAHYCNAEIKVASVPGEGSSIHVFFPKVRAVEQGGEE